MSIIMRKSRYLWVIFIDSDFFVLCEGFLGEGYMFWQFVGRCGKILVRDFGYDGKL